MHRVLVTGGAGYIGSHLVDALAARDYKVTVLDSLEPQVHLTGKWPEYRNTSASYVQGDVTDQNILLPLVLASAFVVHFAAAVSVGQSMYQVQRYVRVNTTGTATLLDILVNNSHRVKKLIVASSVGVYGEGSYTCTTCGPVFPKLRTVSQLNKQEWEHRCPVCQLSVKPIPTPENKPLYRDNIYSMTKFHQEEMALLLGKTYGIPVVAPRFFNVYGPRQSLSNPYAGVAAIFIGRLLNNKAPIVFEDGGQLRDFVSIHDVVDCLVMMLEQSGVDFMPVNIGSGSKISILEIAETLVKLTKKDIEPQVRHSGRKFDIRHCFSDTTRVREALNWEPKVSFDQGMNELIDWALQSSDRPVDLFDKALDELNTHGLLAGE